MCRNGSKKTELFSERWPSTFEFLCGFIKRLMCWPELIREVLVNIKKLLHIHVEIEFAFERLGCVVLMDKITEVPYVHI